MQILEGRTVLVTGSTHGIGRAIAVACARAGAQVVLHGLEPCELADETYEMCQENGTEPMMIFGDLSGPIESCVANVFEQSIEASPDIDILINNAGGYFDVPFLDLDVATFEKTIRLNVGSYFFLTHSFAKRWVEKGVEGRVLMIGSINGRLAEPTHACYDTSKGAVEMMVKTLCVELAPHNIRVNGVAPGLFYTPLTAEAIDQPEFRRWMELHTPNRTIPGPEVAAEMATFLVSDSASHIQGQMVLVDGGMSVWQQPDRPDDFS